MISFILFICYSIFISAFFWYQTKQIFTINLKYFKIITLSIPILNIILISFTLMTQSSALANIYIISFSFLMLTFRLETFFIFMIVHLLIYFLITKLLVMFAYSKNSISFTIVYTSIISIFLTGTVGIIPLMTILLGAHWVS